MTVYEIQLFVEGSKQGKFKGADAEGKIICQSYRSGILSPRDPASGGAGVGKRQHKPLIIIKEINAASPQFAQAIVTGEALKSVTLKFYKTATPASKKKALYYTITLTNAGVTEINQLAAEGSAEAPNEEISFTFQKIEWTWAEGGVTAGDDVAR